MDKNENNCPVCGRPMVDNGDGTMLCPACGYADDGSEERTSEKVANASDAYVSPEMEKVKKCIDALPEFYDVTLSDAAEIRTVRAQYEALKALQIEFSGNANKLFLAEDALELLYKEPAKKVDFLISVLPNADEVTADDADKITACEQALSELDENSRKYIVGEQKLKDVRDRFDEISDPNFGKSEKRRRKELQKQLKEHAKHDMSEEARKKRAKRRKKLIGTSVIVFVLISAIVAGALFWTGVVIVDDLDDFYFHAFVKPTEDLNFELSADGNSYIVTGIADKKAKNVNIPIKYNEKFVTAIADNAFADCVELRQIRMPDRLRSIGAGAFSGCTKLKWVILSCAIQYVGESAFSGCDSLKLNVEKGLCYLGGEEDYPYLVLVRAENKDNIAKAVLHRDARILYEGCFKDCASLESVYFGAAPVTQIMDGAFAYCTSLRSLSLPASIMYVGTGVFDGCSSLDNLSVDPGTVRNIFSIDNVICVSESGKAVAVAPASTPFAKADLWENSGVSAIGNWCCYHRTDLNEIIVPEGVKSVVEGAFADCTALKKITLPSTVEHIDASAFKNCNAIEEIVYCGAEAQFAEIDIDCAELKAVGIKTVYLTEEEESENAEP